MQSKLTVAARNGIEDLAEQTRLSLPFGITTDKGFVVGFLAYLALPRFREPSIIYPPSHVVFVDAEESAFITKTEIKKGDLVDGHTTDKSIGQYGVPDGMTLDEYSDRARKLDDLMIKICRALNKGEDITMHRDGYMNLFFALCEEPLKPYYKKYGLSFFEKISDRPGGGF